jgi:hypothetical protein
MSEGGKDSVVTAKATLSAAGVTEKCVAIFGLVCSAAEKSVCKIIDSLELAVYKYILSFT